MLFLLNTTNKAARADYEKKISIEFFTQSPQYNNGNIANFILAVQYRSEQDQGIMQL